jgi:hypothetical protein
MSRLLAVSWNTTAVRFVYGESGKQGLLRLIDAGERSFEYEDAETTADPSVKVDPSQCILALVRELKATKATLLLCLNRGAVDSVSFQVPPATDAELPAIVNNLAIRQMAGLTEDSVVDFIAYPPAKDGTRRISAMAMAPTDQQFIERMAKETGCGRVRMLVVTHSLRLFIPSADDTETSEILVITKGQQSAHLLVAQNGLPILSRSLRLAPEMKGPGEAKYIAGEVQRTLLSAENDTGHDVEIDRVVVVGSGIESTILVDALSDQFDMTVSRVPVRSLVEGEAGAASVSAYGPLVSALKQEAMGTRPDIDFANPKRPAATANPRNRILAIVAAVLLIGGTGWYYVHSQFATAQEENVQLRERRKELAELVKETRSKRNLAKVLAAWERGRMSWLDELRDITIRMPSSPDVIVQQFSAAASGSSYVVSFRGTGRNPDAIRQMEERLRDKYHEPRTPGVREVPDGKKSVWSFQTTMRVKSRRKDSYVSHLSEDTTQQTATRDAQDTARKPDGDPATTSSATARNVARTNGDATGGQP